MPFEDDDDVFVLRELTPEEQEKADKQKEFELIPEQTQLLVEVDECVARDSIFHEDKDDPNSPLRKEVSFKFRVIDDQYTGRVLWGSTTTAFVNHPNCKLRNWVQSIMGVDELPDNFVFRPSRIQGAICRVVVEHKKKRDGSPREAVRTLLPATDDATAESLF